MRIARATSMLRVCGKHNNVTDNSSRKIHGKEKNNAVCRVSPKQCEVPTAMNLVLLDAQATEQQEATNITPECQLIRQAAQKHAGKVNLGYLLLPYLSLI